MYKCLKRNQLDSRLGYQFVPVRQEDLELIRLWRNDQMDVLRQKVIISPQEQKSYFQTIIFPNFSHHQPKQILFSYLYEKACIGYGGLTHLDWEASHAEVSFLMKTERTRDASLYEQDFTQFLALLYRVAFEDLNLHRLFTETFAFRKAHIAILEKCGFQLEGVLRDHIFKQGTWHHSLIHGLLKGEEAVNE